MVMYPPIPLVHQPVVTEAHVESLCSMPIEGLVMPVAYNITLIFCTAVYGFKTRKLPDNFNESWFIFLSVCSTLFLWIAFLPTYFAAHHNYHKTVVLILSMMLNAAVMVMCLYAPKIYALLLVKEAEMAVNTLVGGAGGQKTTAWAAADENSQKVHSLSGRFSASVEPCDSINQESNSGNI